MKETSRTMLVLSSLRYQLWTLGEVRLLFEALNYLVIDNYTCSYVFPSCVQSSIDSCFIIFTIFERTSSLTSKTKRLQVH